jgi:putative acetyltransferase
MKYTNIEIAKMIIREANVDDAQTLKELHNRSVLALCSKDYSAEQLEDWVKFSTVERYQERLKFHRTFVGEIEGLMVGFVRWNPATNELCSIFVDPDHTRRGIGTRLMKKAYEDALAMGVEKMWLYASLTAVPFYKAESWNYLELTKRGSLACIRMEKSLTTEKG